mmetsp:Transcript_10110/g.20111  ORF Transcript_10110/g.20111 Transcript_10110/m.20111 type:complete len:352 (+) Transcript_10110:118-1173(+)
MLFDILQATQALAGTSAWGGLLGIFLAVCVGSCAGVYLGTLLVRAGDAKKEEKEEKEKDMMGVVDEVDEDGMGEAIRGPRDLVYNEEGEGEGEAGGEDGRNGGRREATTERGSRRPRRPRAQKLAIIDVGGQKFTTTLATITSSENYFASNLRFRDLQSLNSDSDSDPSEGGPVEFFVDRDPTHFRHILNYLRSSGASPCHLSRPDDLSELLAEAKFYSLPLLASSLESSLSRLRKLDSDSPTSDKEFKMVHVRTLPMVESTFRSYVSRGYEFVQVMRTGGGEGAGWCPGAGGGTPGSPGPASPQGRRAPAQPAQDAAQGTDDGFRAIMVFSKSLTKADVTFFDRLMSSAG